MEGNRTAVGCVILVRVKCVQGAFNSLVCQGSHASKMYGISQFSHCLHYRFDTCGLSVKRPNNIRNIIPFFFTLKIA